MTDFLNRLRQAEQRIDHGTRERSAGADDKARAIADEVARRGHGGAKSLAGDLGVSEKTISQAVTRARNAGNPYRALPHDTLDRLLALELRDIPALPAEHWQALAYIVNDTIIDITWLEEPSLLLADEAEDLDDEHEGTADLATACRNWTRIQALAVIDAILRGDLAALPTQE
ncbi:hypothetical protein [Streptomyces sp. WAC08241]|uniref:hypothetical protein n=1 Tax=Streptomyces sp. WAC08241 TaxID=2487421 RepID=UPI000F795980|nr:hypothetical protein [Streptomyces sp. WAC08241]RSS38910.1 hypothetical protein EF906_20040 [Streptomyces sp. WAC08241]